MINKSKIGYIQIIHNTYQTNINRPYSKFVYFYHCYCKLDSKSVCDKRVDKRCVYSFLF